MRQGETGAVELLAARVEGAKQVRTARYDPEALGLALVLGDGTEVAMQTGAGTEA